MKIDARLTFEKICHDQDRAAHLVLTVTAPALDAQAKRPRICIIPVIDVSPSMFEHDGAKIAYAKKSVEKLIDHLGPEDYCGLVKFSMTADVVHKPVKITADSKRELKRSIAELRCGNATNIADAILTGLDVGNKLDLPGTVITRVILFTDGQANRGIATTTPELVKLLEANVGSCTLSAFSYGADADQNLLGELAKKGTGNYAYVQNPDDALTAFGKELGGLLSTYATNLEFNISACSDNEITDVVSDVDSEEEKIGEGVRIKIPDILAEETRHVVLAVKVKAQKVVLPRPVNLFEVNGGYDVLGADSKKQRLSCDVKVKGQFVKEADAQKVPDADLDKIVSMAEVVRAQLEAEEQARKGNYNGAVHRMKTAAVNLGRRGHLQAEHVASAMAARLGSAEAYAHNGGYLRSMSAGMTRGMSVSSYQGDAAADLGQWGVSMSNSSQTSTSSAFAGGGSVHIGDGTVNMAGPLGATASGGGGFAVLNGQPHAPTATFGVLGDPVSPGVVPTVTPPLPRTDSKDGQKPSKKSKLSKKSKSW